MSSLSNYLENEVLDHVLGTGSYTAPSTIYVALYTVAPTDAGGGTEVTGGGYARQTATFSAASAGATANTNEVTWTASGANYGTVLAMALFDAVSGGNMLMWDGVTSQVVNDGETYRFPIGDIDITLD